MRPPCWRKWSTRGRIRVHCHGKSSEQYEIVLTTRVDCDPSCRILPGRQGEHVVELENIHVVQVQVTVVAELNGIGPLGFHEGRKWETVVNLPPPRRFSRASKCAPLRETITHTTSQAAPGGLESLHVHAKFRVGQGPEECVGTVALQLHCN